MSDTSIRLFGGEMLNWSDHDPGRCAPPWPGQAISPLLEPLLSPSSRVLVAGPHDPLVVDLVLRHAKDVTCLVRSLPDAQELVSRHAELEVVCSAVDMVSELEPFDVIVALAGVERLTSVDSEEASFDEVLALLSDMLSSEGILVLGMDNPLGIHRFVDPAPVLERGDGAWERPAAPRSLRQVLGDLQASRLRHMRTYVGHGGPDAPGVWLEESILSGHPCHDVLSQVIIEATNRGFLGRLRLSDPEPHLRTALALGEGALLAPFWTIVAARGDASLPLPDVAGAEPDPWGLAFTLTRDPAGQWQRTSMTRDVRSSGRVSRDPELYNGPLQGGELFERTLLAACAADDTRAIRRLFSALADWLDIKTADGVLPGTFAFASTDNLIVVGDKFALYDPSWQHPGSASPNVVLGRILHDFATRLIRSGHHHPWPAYLDVISLTSVLLSMAGRRLDCAAMDAAIALDEEIRAAIGETGCPVRERARALEAIGYREALERNEQLRREVQAGREHVAWMETLLSTREKRVEKLEQRIKLLRQRAKPSIRRKFKLSKRRFNRALGRLLAKS